MATNNSLLCRHLSSETGEHFCLYLLNVNYVKLSFVVVDWIRVVVHHQAPPSFERGNTKLPNAISLLPYFKLSSYKSVGTKLVRNVTAPPVHILTLRPCGWLGFKTTLILNNVMI